jgi:hypothetical protein
MTFGYFSGTNIYLFSVFSLTEHLVFALEAIPFGLLAAAFAGMVMLTYRALNSILGERIDKRWLPTGSGFAMTALSLYSLANHINELVALFVLLAIGFFLSAVPFKLAKEVLPTYTAFSVLLVALIAGLQFSRSVGSQNLSSDTVVAGEKEIEIKGKLIRSGDKGIMFYDAGTKLITILRWDAIKRITTQPNWAP